MVEQDSIRPPPPEYVDREYEPLLRPRDAYGTAYNPSHAVGPHISIRRQENEHPQQRGRGVSIKVFLYWGFLCAIVGAVVQQWISVDPRDPNARQRILEKWKQDVEHQQQLRNQYKQEAEEWNSRARNFEKEWQEKLDEKTRELERAGLVWGEFVGDPECASSGRRKYYARLWNLTPSLSGTESCNSTPATINGITYDTPVSCEDKGILGVYGHWMAENEAICSTFWESVKRNDCTAPGSGLRRYQAKLGDFHPGEDAEKLCLSTPLTINGQVFQRPTACSIRGYQGLGPWAEPEYWGIWDVPDEACTS